MLIDLNSTFAADARLTPESFESFAATLQTDLPPSSTVFSTSTSVSKAVQDFLSTPPVYNLLISASRTDVFTSELAEAFSTCDRDIAVLRVYKILKYCYNLPTGQLFIEIVNLLHLFSPSYALVFQELADRVLGDADLRRRFVKHVVLSKSAPSSLRDLYAPYEDSLLEADPHAVYPTSIYRSCFGHCASTSDSTHIEGVMGTTLTTTIRIVRDVLSPTARQLRDVYKPLGRCVAVVDERLDTLYGKELSEYFAAHNIDLEKLVYRCMEADKDISTVENILVDLKKRRVSRNEPVLIMGGGVMADVGGFACALYHRNTPYVMLCTSIVSGIDAGPSPRTCCDGLGYKNVFGAYHPPVLTLTDRQFFTTLHPGWIRHGIAEIVKMACVKDATLFECLERAGNRLVETKFGVENCERGSDIDQLSESIIAKAMDGYVRSEYGNLWETHQCRPHAFGHTWSPGFELQAGLLHGHAVAIGMGFGAYLSYLEGWISEHDFHRILTVMSNVGLALRHDILENIDSIWSAQVKMTEKRGGNLCAPVPRGSIGQCGYINDVSRERLEETLQEYQNIVKNYPREGFGVDPHCHDVGLEDPSTVKQHAENAIPNGRLGPNSNGNGAEESNALNGNGQDENEESAIDTYNKWVVSQQEERNRAKTSSSLGAKLVLQKAMDTASPPDFASDSLFHDQAEEYASDMTTLSSADFATVATETERVGLFAPCMVGKLEGQFLKMVTRMTRAKRVLDIGTFTGYSALAFAEGMGTDGEVVTIEADAKTAEVARGIFAGAKHGNKISLEEGDARVMVKEMREQGEKFDIVFLDADKTNYKLYYEEGLQMLKDGGVLMADNALCSLVYGKDDPARQSLHEFAQHVRADERVEQVMLTVREGILIVQKV